MAPLVSVIIPVYNVFPYLRESLDSVINQTYHNLEIIIVDDGSTDGSGSICDEYMHDIRVKVIHQDNCGLCGARNTGLNLMTGEYVAFLDPDDAFCPDAIEKMMRAVLQNNADLAVCGFDILATNGNLTGSRRIDLLTPEKEAILAPREALNALLLGRFAIQVWNKLYTVEVWKTLRFPVGVVYEDLRIMPIVLEKCRKIAVIPQILVHQRRRKGSITQSDTIQNIKDQTDAYRLFRDYMEKVQPALSYESLLFFQEKYLRTLIFSWAKLKKLNITGKELDVQKKEIQKLAYQIEQLQQLKTKFVWWLFCHCPHMLLPFKIFSGKLISFFRRNGVLTI